MLFTKNILKYLLFIPILSASIFAQSVVNSYTVNQQVAIGGNSPYYVQITGAPSNAIITNIQAKFDYIAYGVVQNYVSVRFNKGANPGTTGGITLVSQGSLLSGNPGTYGFVSLNNWNGQAVNDNYYFNFAVASGSTNTATINTIYVTVSYSVPSLTVTSPNGGESWQAGATQNITWTSSGITGTVQIQPYLGGVAQTNLAAAAPNTGTYSWAIPSNYTPGTTYKIGISAMSGSVSDFSDANFSITAPAGTITVTSPNGGESWQAGTTQNITWTSSGITGTVQIQPYLGGVAQTNLAAAAPNTGTYSWAIPLNYTLGTTYKIGISAMSGSVSGFSNANFTITAPAATITVTSPVGGETWQAGTQQTVTWTTTNFTDNVHIQFYKGGITSAYALQNITASTPNTGSYAFTVPASLAAGSDYKIGMSDASTGIPSNFSPNYFSITAPAATITITSPVGGETWQAGTTQNITWTSSGITGTVQIQPYLNGVAQTNLAAAAPNTGTYSWAIPSNYTPGTTYKIGISAMSGSVSDFSDANFSITANNPTTPLIQLAFPIPNHSSSTMTITSILDHSPHETPYKNYKDKSGKPLYPIIDFMNERAGLTDKDWLLQNKIFGGKNSSISKFLNGYAYPQSDKTVWYSGHPGYDYSTKGTNGAIFADAPGTVFYPKTNADFGYRLHYGYVPGQYGVLGIDHRNSPSQGTGYVSFFMHLRTNPYLNKNSTPIDLPQIVPDGTVISQSQVDNGFQIGIAGGVAAGQKNGTAVHLHYELHWVNSKGNHIIVDPYGWSPSDNSIDSLPLSTFNLRDGVGDDRPASDKSKNLWSNTTLTSTANLNKLQKSLSSNSSWQQISSPVSATFRGVCFPSNSIGYICGNEGVILKTINGGTTWQTAYSNANAYISKIFFTSALAGIAVGKNIILQTTDGGTTWQNRWLNAAQATTWDTTNNSVFLDRISFSPNGTGFVSGCYANDQNISPVLWRTTSGGTSWDYIAQFMATGNYNEKFVGGLDFVSDSIGYAGVYTRDYGADSGGLTLDSNKIYKTYDGGNSWYESTVADDIGDIRFVSADTGYAFGYSTLFKTVTGTSNQPIWYTADSFPSGINDIAVSAGSLICVGNNGNIAISGNGGLWVNDSSGTTSDLNAICSQNGVTCVVGDNGTILIKEYAVDSRTNQALLPNHTQLCSINSKCLRYYLSAPNHVTIRIVDSKGRVIENIENAQKSQGYYNINYNIRNQSKGIYVIWFKAGDYTQGEKIYLLGKSN